MATSASPQRILIITDAWHPQINGVVRTIMATAAECRALGHEVNVIGPDPAQRGTLALPGYREISLEFFAKKRIDQFITTWQPTQIHIATEGPLGWAARRICLKRQRPFTTAYHTCFPEYIETRLQRHAWCPRLGAALARRLSYLVLRHFHAPAQAVLVATASIENLLRQNHFNPEKLCRWHRGVDLDVFTPAARDPACYQGLKHPIALYVGRVAIEKNVEAFLAAPLPGSKVVVGNGPQLKALKATYPDILFVGEILAPQILARYYASADFLVFPSQTDTFGLVMLEALACGLPIAATPSPGPLDIFSRAPNAEFYYLDYALTTAATAVMRHAGSPAVPRAFVATHFAWRACTQQFLTHITRHPMQHQPTVRVTPTAPRRLLFASFVYNSSGLRHIGGASRQVWRVSLKMLTLTLSHR